MLLKKKKKIGEETFESEEAAWLDGYIGRDGY